MEKCQTAAGLFVASEKLMRTEPTAAARPVCCGRHFVSAFVLVFLYLARRVVVVAGGGGEAEGRAEEGEYCRVTLHARAFE